MDNVLGFHLVNDVPADRVATSRGPLGIEQPFLGFDEFIGSSAFQADNAFRYFLYLSTPLYDAILEKYGWPEGTQLFLELSPEFAGWRIIEATFPLDALSG